MLRRISGKPFMFFLIGMLLAAGSASAQNIAYRQHNLASDVASLADKTDPFLLDPWGIALDPGVSFIVANSNRGRVISLDAAGGRTTPPSFSVPNPAGNGPAAPTGVVTDLNSFFGTVNSLPPLRISTITATADGGIYFWFVNADGTLLPQATLVVDQSRAGAVYTGLAILTPACCAEFLAAANFHTGSIESYTSRFDRLAPPGSFTDPNLPAGFAPFGMQVLGNRVFITYGLQDAAKQNPVIGAGNGIVSIFDLEGNFVRRFATAGPLNAPWGIGQASANFGPFSNDILIGNTGDGTIDAFDPATGNFAGQIKDGDGNVLVIDGLHALASGPQVVGDPNALYFTAGIAGGQDGLFGSIATGLVSTTRVTVPPTAAGTAAQITVTVSAGPGNAGTPRGLVTLLDGGAVITEVPLTDGMALFDTALRGVGIHHIEARYRGDDTFLPSTSQTDTQVTGTSTTLALAAPANAAPGSPVTLTATVSSAGGTPTGDVAFLDNNTVIGFSVLNADGVATFTTSTLAAGAHTLSASYGDEGGFAGSVSAPVTTTIAARDFALVAAPPAATVTAGQSASFNISITPSGGFADPVTLSCPPVTGITCSFTQPTVTPNAAMATTTLTVTTSANVLHFGETPGKGTGWFTLGLGLLGLLISFLRRSHQPRRAALGFATSMLAVVALALTLLSCGYSANSQAYRGTALVSVTAQSGAIVHTTTVSIAVQ
ncbi:MAG: TIGR03118 family protein [Acidobacteriia bacterium]|nr:TIGR03118 family protein [Terriglobia bacterium]